MLFTTNKFRIQDPESRTLRRGRPVKFLEAAILEIQTTLHLSRAVHVFERVPRAELQAELELNPCYIKYTTSSQGIYLTSATDLEVRPL